MNKYIAKKYKFDIYFPGDTSAGLHSYTDEVEIIVDSGNPGGENEEFEEYMKQCISEWYDGSKVTIIK
jgi:hypothetical protein